MDNDSIQGTDDIDARLAAATAEPQAPIEPADDKQPEPMPSSDQTPPKEVEETPVDEEKEALESSKNPERTKAYIEKLKAELAAEKAKKQSNEPASQDFGTSVFDTFRSPEPATSPQVGAADFGSLNQNQVDAIASQFIDQEGNVDINGLNQALAQADQRAQRAERQALEATAKIERFEETQQVREAHTVYPQLDPRSESFDKGFFEAVRDRILRTKYWEGQQVTLLDAAKDVATSFRLEAPVNVAKVKEEAVAEYKATQTHRDQGPIESGKGESRQTSQTDLTDLRERSLRGDEDALMERLKRATESNT